MSLDRLRVQLRGSAFPAVLCDRGGLGLLCLPGPLRLRDRLVPTHFLDLFGSANTHWVINGHHGFVTSVTYITDPPTSLSDLGVLDGFSSGGVLLRLHLEISAEGVAVKEVSGERRPSSPRQTFLT